MSRLSLATLAMLLLWCPPLLAQDAKDAPKVDEGFEDSEVNLLEEAESISKQVAEIRGLELLGPIQKGIKQREELRATLIEKLAEEVSDEQIAAEGKVYARLGLIGEDVDYKQVLLDVLTEQIAGFYDQKAKELYIMRGIPLSLQRPAMAHELFHAIQDQHFDILSLQEPFSTVENGDFALARSALIEGDATVVMFDFSLYEAGTLPQDGAKSIVDIPMFANILQQLTFEDLTAIESMLGGGSSGFGAPSAGDTAMAKAPAIFREMLMFPYFAGMRFIVSVRRNKAWSDVDAIYKNAPVSTEQIMHPERYFEGDEPEILAFDPSKALPGHEKIYDSVMGEFQTLLFLKEQGPGQGFNPSAAAAGWDGDRLLAYEKDGKVVVVHLSVWDTINDAREYYDAGVKLMEKRHPGTTSSATGKHGQSACRVNEKGERIYVEQWGDMVLYIEGTPSKLDESGNETDGTTWQVRDAVWKTHSRQSFDAAVKARKAAAKSD